MVEVEEEMEVVEEEEAPTSPVRFSTRQRAESEMFLNQTLRRPPVRCDSQLANGLKGV